VPSLLLVEDNPLIVELLTQLLEDDYDVRSAANGRLGVEAARAERPDVILMDLNMPVMNGWRAIELLRAEWATCRIPIIALTAEAGERELRRAIELGADACLKKPIVEIALFEALKRFVGEMAPSGVRVKRDVIGSAIDAAKGRGSAD